jgi:plasmid stabilization system protein ParE
MKVVITDAAYADLRSIAQYSLDHFPELGTTLVDDLEEKCLQLGRMALKFPLAPKWAKHGVRKRTCRSYLIFYRIASRTVEMLHVVHAARDYESFLFRMLDS